MTIFFRLGVLPHSTTFEYNLLFKLVPFNCCLENPSKTIQATRDRKRNHLNYWHFLQIQMKSRFYWLFNCSTVLLLLHTICRILLHAVYFVFRLLMHLCFVLISFCFAALMCRRATSNDSNLRRPCGVQSLKICKMCRKCRRTKRWNVKICKMGVTSNGGAHGTSNDGAEGPRY